VVRFEVDGDSATALGVEPPLAMQNRAPERRDRITVGERLHGRT
jgi:hypothetical protein